MVFCPGEPILDLTLKTKTILLMMQNFIEAAWSSDSCSFSLTACTSRASGALGTSGAGGANTSLRARGPGRAGAAMLAVSVSCGSRGWKKKEMQPIQVLP